MIARSTTPWKQAQLDLDQRPVYLDLDDYRKLEALTSDYNARNGSAVSLADMVGGMINARFERMIETSEE